MSGLKLKQKLRRKRQKMQNKIQMVFDKIMTNRISQRLKKDYKIYEQRISNENHRKIKSVQKIKTTRNILFH